MTWTQLAKELEVSHQKFMQIAILLPPTLREKSGVCGEWSPKDVVAHLLGWDTEAVYFLGLFAEGKGETYDYEFDIDEFNAHSVKTRDNLSWDEVMTDLSTVHAELQQIVMGLDAKNLNSDTGFGRSLIGRKADYIVHTKQLEDWLPPTD